MTSQGSKIFLLVNILSVIRASHLETVHFTNSANKILKANNFTTYKVDVPNGEPITIIEANVPLIDKKIKFDDAEPAQYPKRHNQYHDDDSTNRKYNKPVMDLETSLSMTVTPNNYHDEYENSAAASAIGEEESVKNDYSNLSPEQLHNKRNTMKTVYSPELLQKFLKDYANKVQNMATASTEDFQAEKDKYVESQEQVNVNDDDGNRRVSNAENEDKSEELEDIQQRKNYRPGNHPYNKNSGWVTLDAVPWSKSKVSRWQANQKYQNNYNNRPYRPQSSGYDYDYNGSNDNNDDYYAPKPSRPTYQNNQFYNNRPQSQESSHSWHTSQQFHSSAHNNNYDNDQRPNRPNSDGIITDNRPSNFPSHNEDHYHQQKPQQQHNYAFSKPYNRPSSYNNNNNNNNDYSYNNHGSHFNSYKDGPHPQSYPQNGDGEWILVSTTKGYQYPKRSGQRAMSIKTQNSVGGSTDAQYNDRHGIITAAESQKVDTVVRPPHHYHGHHRPSPTKMTQQQAVKLTVLPLFINEQKPTSSNSYNNNGDKVNVSLYKPSSTSQYHGIIESDQSDMTVEESAQSAHVAAASPQKKKRKVIKKKNYALMRKNGGSDSSAVIAAVGASLLPASLGLIAPMVLGK